MFTNTGTETLKPNLVKRITRLKSYKTLAFSTLLYDSEIWTIKQCDKNRLRTAEMKYLLRTAEYTLLNHKKRRSFRRTPWHTLRRQIMNI
jgi:hypothetical protein